MADFPPTTIYDEVFDLSDFDGLAYVDGIPRLCQKIVLHVANQWNGTTTASMTIGGGQKSFTTQTGKPWRVGAPLRLSSQVAPASAWMDGVVTAYDPTTGACTLQVARVGGSGSYSSWVINAGGGGGIDVTAPVGVAQGGTGASDPAGARSVLQAAYSGIVITAGEGLDGGGPLTGNVTLAFAPGEEPEEPPDINADMFVYWDSVSGRARRVRMSAVLAQTAADIGALQTVTIDPTNDYVALFHAASNGSAKGKLSALGLLPVGSLVPWAGAAVTAPSGFLLCYGQRVAKSDYPLLWNVLGDTWGQSDAAQFVIPDLRGRVAAGFDGMGGTPAFRLGATLDKGGTVGAAGGEEYHTLTAAEMPVHSHAASTDAQGNHQHAQDPNTQIMSPGANAGFGVGPDGGNVRGGTTQAAGSHAHNVAIGNAGGGQKHNNVQPTAMVNYLIRAA